LPRFQVHRITPAFVHLAGWWGRGGSGRWGARGSGARGTIPGMVAKAVIMMGQIGDAGERPEAGPTGNTALVLL